ncbi:acetate--CoA ligase family protein [bacterium]|nr:acetate--CoA ligase family protein [bacterium]
MRIFEYQAKFLLTQSGIPVPEGFAASHSKTVQAASKCIQPPFVVKAQVLSGGRKEAGGIRIVSGRLEAVSVASGLLGSVLKPAGSGPVLVRLVLVERMEDVAAELYAAVALDRDSGRVSLLVSGKGGTGVEEAEPVRFPLTASGPEHGFSPGLPLEAAAAMGLSGTTALDAARVLSELVRFFFLHECTLVEINPLALTRDGRIVCLDAKMEIDDYSLFRHPETAVLSEPSVAFSCLDGPASGRSGRSSYDFTESDARGIAEALTLSALEENASICGGRIPFVRMAGEVGVLANGAGLAMATTDALAAAGVPASAFCDIGGAASAADVEEAVIAVLSAPGTRRLVVHVYGGIVRCDAVAEGLVSALKRTGLSPEITVRFEGNRKQEGLDLLAASGIPFRIAGSFEEAVGGGRLEL